MNKPSRRIGLIGYNSNTGLGEMNRQIAANVPLASWMLIGHRRASTIPIPDAVRQYHRDAVAPFLDSVDVVVFAETPFVKSLPADARRRGKRIVCIPMIELLPKPN